MPQNICSPNFYTHLSDDAAMIQAAVNAATAAGESVTIPRRNARTGADVWRLPRAVELPSGAHVILDNAYLVHADESCDNLFKSTGAQTPAAAERLHDIRISGLGRAVLDGGKHNGVTEWTWRELGICRPISNSAIHFHNVERFVVENLTVHESRYWGMTFHYCAEGRISGIRFENSGYVINQDGIDLRTGCHDILIEDITGFTGDDVVALTCLDDYAGAMRIDGLTPDLYNVVIRSIRAYSSDGRGIVRLLNHYGHKLYNILVEDIVDLSAPGDPHRDGAAIRIGENAYVREGAPMAKLGETYNVTVRNVITRARHGVFVSCTLENALIDNIQMHGDGGCGLLFREGTMRNIRVRDLTMSAECATPDTDDSPSENCWNRRSAPDRPVEENRVYMVYFQGTDAKNLRFDGITAGKKLDAVFGGFGDVELYARDIIRQNAAVPMLDVAEGVKANITEW